MSANPNWSAAFLLECPNAEVRKPIGLVVVQALETVLKAATGLQSANVKADAAAGAANDVKTAPPASDAKTGDGAKYLAICTRFIDSVLSLLKFAPEHWKKFESYFRVLHAYASFGPAQAQYLVRTSAPLSRSPARAHAHVR